MSSLDSPVYSHAKKTIYEDQPKKNPPLLRSSSPAQLAPSFEYRTQEMVSNERKRAASTTVGPKAVKREQMSPEKTPTTFTVGTPAPSPTAGVPVTVSGQWNQPSIPVKVVPKQHVTSMDDGPESSFSLTETKLQKTRKHMQELDKEALTACNRALYAFIPHTISAARSIYHRPLKRVIASMKLPGLLRLQEYVESYYMYYVLLFSSTELRDQAITQISRTSFSFNERTIRILAHPYGDPKFQPSSIWDVSASLLANSTDIRDAVICYIQLHVPGFETSFTVQEYAEYGYGTGEWAVRLDNPLPIFADEMKVGDSIAFVKSSRETHCRGCGLTTHHVLECKSPGIRAMHHDVVTGTTSALPEQKSRTAGIANVSHNHHRFNTTRYAVTSGYESDCDEADFSDD